METDSRTWGTGRKQLKARPAGASADKCSLLPYLQSADLPIREHPSRRLQGDRLCHEDPISHQLNFKSIFICRPHLKEGRFLTSLGNPFILGLPGTPVQPYLQRPQAVVFPGRVSPIYRPPGGQRLGRQMQASASKAPSWLLPQARHPPAVTWDHPAHLSRAQFSPFSPLYEEGGGLKAPPAWKLQ